MRTLLFGLFVGYFFTACAPVHWRSAQLSWLVALLSLLILMMLWLHGPATGRSLHRTLAACCRVFAGALLASLVMACAIYNVEHTTATHGAGGACANSRLMMRLRVEGLPVNHQGGARFDARVLDVASNNPRRTCQGLRQQWLRLGYRGAQVRPNQILLAQVQLRPIRGSVSPGAFDQELHAASRGILLGGYVVRGYSVSYRDIQQSWRFAAGPFPWLLQGHFADARFAWREYFAASQLKFAGILLALATGDASLVRPDQWQLLQDSGTVHLLVISGLHVGLIGAVLFYLLHPVALLLLQLIPNSLSWLPVHALLVSAATYIYVLWVGSGIPAQRAWIMLTLLLLGWSAARRLPPSTLILCAFLGIVILQPLAGLTIGFWLSFALVAWLLVGPKTAPFSFDSQENTLSGRLKTWRSGFYTHLQISLVLVPLLAWFDLPVALAAPVANLIAVPFVTLLLVPLILFGTALMPLVPQLAYSCLVISDQLTAWLFTGLASAVSNLAAISLPTFGYTSLVCLSLLLTAVLLPVAVLFRAAILIVLAVWLVNPDLGLRATDSLVDRSPAEGEFILQVLDVGQGLSVIVRTAEAVVLYDTGARFPSGFSFAEAVVKPALRRLGVSKLDALVISHPDDDHAGGADLISDAFRPEQRAGLWVSAAPGDGLKESRSCHWQSKNGVSHSWRSGGVELLLRSFEAGESTNDRSCILWIKGASAQALLAGDIEADAEAQLHDQLPFGVDLLVVPHHGSLTSSTRAFVNRLHPGLAVVSAGYENRFGHPNELVVERYRSVGARVLNTAYEGTMDWSSTDVASVASARQLRLKRWRLGVPLLIALDRAGAESDRF